MFKAGCFSSIGRFFSCHKDMQPPNQLHRKNAEFISEMSEDPSNFSKEESFANKGSSDYDGELRKASKRNKSKSGKECNLKSKRCKKDRKIEDETWKGNKTIPEAFRNKKEKKDDEFLASFKMKVDKEKRKKYEQESDDSVKSNESDEISLMEKRKSKRTVRKSFQKPENEKSRSKSKSKLDKKYTGKLGELKINKRGKQVSEEDESESTTTQEDSESKKSAISTNESESLVFHDEQLEKLLETSEEDSSYKDGTIFNNYNKSDAFISRSINSFSKGSELTDEKFSEKEEGDSENESDVSHMIDFYDKTYFNKSLARKMANFLKKRK